MIFVHFRQRKCTCQGLERVNSALSENIRRRGVTLTTTHACLKLRPAHSKRDPNGCEVRLLISIPMLLENSFFGHLLSIKRKLASLGASVRLTFRRLAFPLAFGVWPFLPSQPETTHNRKYLK